MFRKLTIISGVIIVCLSIAGCGGSKVFQCSQLVSIVNKGNTLVNAQTSYDATTTNELGEELEEIAQELENLKLKDENLQQFQQEFFESFRELSQEFVNMSLGLKTSRKIEASLEGSKKFNQAKDQVTQAGEQANKLANNQDILLEELISYCQNN
ncbi:hypothetical protein [Okeania sp.]|uniref:hypothetical protein n=1 Tax=Okeania sp. TaxID=3100323 RepID=UPI002B4AF98C|nr:hypothetical protein [Okeania sp.]MEB3341954.1 hypothetical protein [Okeania sp.]